MRVIIEFCRTRRRGRELATIDRVYCDALNAEAAKGIAVTLAATRVLPQTPDIVRVLDEKGIEFFRKTIAPETSLLRVWPAMIIEGDLEK